jgi:tetratricopeptide (TPR) repeat protein
MLCSNLCYNLYASNELKIDSTKIILDEINSATNDTVKLEKLIALSQHHREQYDYDKALEVLTRASLILNEANYPRWADKVYQRLAQIHLLRNEPDMAIRFLEKRLSNDPSDGLQLAGIYNDLHIANLHKGEYNKALEYLLNCVRICEDLNEKKFLNISYHNLGLLYQLIGKFDKSHQILKKALNLAIELKDDKSIARAYAYMGVSFMKMQQYDSALVYLHKSEQLQDNIMDISSTYNKLSQIYRYKENYQKSLSYLNKSMDINKMKSDKAGLINNYIELGDYYFELNKWDAADEAYTKALDLTMDVGISIDLVEIQERKVKLLEQTGRFSEALQLFRQLHLLKDSLNSIKVVKATEEIYALYELEKKEKAIKQHKSEIEIQRLQIRKEKTFKYLGLVGVLILAILTYLFWNRYKTNRMLNEAEIQEMQDELFVIETRFKEKNLERDKIAGELEQTRLNLSETKKKLLKEQKLNIEHQHLENQESNLEKQLQNSDEDIQNLKVFYDLRRQMNDVIINETSSTIEINQIRDMISNMFIEEKNKEFVNKIKRDYPDLSVEELRLAAAIRSDLINTEIAIFLQISSHALYTRKTRLKQKFNLGKKDSLKRFLLDY